MARPTRTRNALVLAAGAALFLGTAAPPAYAHPQPDPEPDDGLRTVVDGLNMPRGVASVGKGMTLVSEVDGTFSLVVERRHRAPRVIPLNGVGAGGIAPSIDVGPRGMVYILTGAGGGMEAQEMSASGATPAEPVQDAASLFKWRPGWSAPKLVADIAAYQAEDGNEDPYNREGDPHESNPFGVEALDDGSVLVADAAGNDLLRVDKWGDIETVAMIKPRWIRTSAAPSGPSASSSPGGSGMLSEAVPTAVTVGADGYWYVAELRGAPGTPGTSQIWRIDPDSEGVVCDPQQPTRGDCVRYADGLTALIDLSADDEGSLFALSLSKAGLAALEGGESAAATTPAPGALFEIRRNGSRGHWDDDDDWDDDGFDWNRDWDWDDYEWQDRPGGWPGNDSPGNDWPGHGGGGWPGNDWPDRDDCDDDGYQGPFRGGDNEVTAATEDDQVTALSRGGRDRHDDCDDDDDHGHPGPGNGGWDDCDDDGWGGHRPGRGGDDEIDTLTEGDQATALSRGGRGGRDWHDDCDDDGPDWQDRPGGWHGDRDCDDDRWGGHRPGRGGDDDEVVALTTEDGEDALVLSRRGRDRDDCDDDRGRRHGWHGHYFEHSHYYEHGYHGGRGWDDLGERWGHKWGDKWDRSRDGFGQDDVDELVERVSARVSRHGSRDDYRDDRGDDRFDNAWGHWDRDRGRWQRDRNRFRVTITELVELPTPGGVDVSDEGVIYLVGPLFSQDGELMRLDD